MNRMDRRERKKHIVSPTGGRLKCLQISPPLQPDMCASCPRHRRRAVRPQTREAFRLLRKHSLQYEYRERRVVVAEICFVALESGGMSSPLLG